MLAGGGGEGSGGHPLSCLIRNLSLPRAADKIITVSVARGRKIIKYFEGGRSHRVK